MTKKTEEKSKAKGADAEQRVLKKIQDGNKKAKDAKMAAKSGKQDSGKHDSGKQDSGK